MSKAIKKVFKGVKKVVKKTTNFVKDHWKEIVLVGAAVFTAGAALGYVGMNAAGGLAFSGFGSSGLGAFGGAITTKGIGAAWAGLGNTVTQALGMGNKFGSAAVKNMTAPEIAAAKAGGSDALLSPVTTTGQTINPVTGAKVASETAVTPAVAAEQAGVPVAAVPGGEAAASGWTAGDKVAAVGAGAQVFGAAGKYLEGDPDETEFIRHNSIEMPVYNGAAQPGGNAQRGLMQPVRTRRQSTTDRDTVARRTYRGYA